MGQQQKLTPTNVVTKPIVSVVKPTKNHSKRRTYQIGIAQQFVVEGYVSKPQLISSRVPQGSVMGSLLLSTNMKDRRGCLLHTKTHMFTDGTTINTSSLSSAELMCQCK